MDADKETNKIFIFGLCILIAWMIVIIICASPKLFRDFLSRLCFCSIARRREARKIDEAKYRMHYASCLPLTQVIAIEPSNIMVTQAFGNNIHLLIKTVEKETHMAPIVRPEETDALTNSTDNERDSLTVTAGDDGMLLPIRTIH